MASKTWGHARVTDNGQNDLLISQYNMKVAISFIIPLNYFLFAEKLMMSHVMPKTLEVDCDSQDKSSSLEPQSLSIALLDWTIKQERDVWRTPLVQL